MTREEAITELKCSIELTHFDPFTGETYEWLNAEDQRYVDACNMAIEALEQEPKPGHWIEYTRVLIPEPINKWEQAWYCSECGYGNQECEDGSAWLEWNYCPNCGCRMIDPQESEDKE